MPESYKIVEDGRTMTASRAYIIKDPTKRSFAGTWVYDQLLGNVIQRIQQKAIR